MASFIIEGGHSLSGTITRKEPRMRRYRLPAPLLTCDEVVIENIPDILDVNNLIRLLRRWGNCRKA